MKPPATAAFTSTPRMKAFRKAMPAFKTFAGGPWFEEDCDWCAVALVFAAEFAAAHPGRDVIEDAKRTLRDYQPDVYEAFYGVTLQPGQSRARDERAWWEANKTRLIAVSACGDWHKDCPAGMVLVSACVGGRHWQTYQYCGEMRQFLVPADDYQNRSPFGFAFDEGRYAELQTAASASA